MNLAKYQTPDEKAQRMLTLRFKRDQLREMLNTLDEEYDAIRDELLTETQKLGIITLKTENYTISRKKSLNPHVVDQAKAIEDMNKRGLTPIMKLDALALKGTFLAAARNATPIDGVEIKETEYIAIKKAESRKEK